MDINKIAKILPHRYPFLLIDKIFHLDDKSVGGIKNVTYNEPFFQGHFPGKPVMPGVLIIEAMAQTAAVLVVHTLGPNAEGKLVYFMTIDDARFRKPVMPGDTLHVHVRKKRSRNNVWKFEAQAKVDGAVVAQATYAAMILDE